MQNGLTRKRRTYIIETVTATFKTHGIEIHLRKYSVTRLASHDFGYEKIIRV